MVKSIISSIGTEEFSEDLITSKKVLYVHMSLIILCYYISIEGCKTYKKTLAEREKHTRTPVKLQKQIRSRKQRVCMFIYFQGTSCL